MPNAGCEVMKQKVFKEAGTHILQLNGQVLHIGDGGGDFSWTHNGVTGWPVVSVDTSFTSTDGT